ncbi:MAG: hypothetical protein COX80_04625 [Candidatus Magasanikbacteria bacterium CG_4_10_14_0_2_um_filter_33_14]|uniref:Uncharacterized protein n=1 Tax=Candidatus Magasanikbacteria bacterium CG_4_10_14_0_2_um_filter_33_14 TaxID=1974636 RepID=A0A2M7V944_9BACT|nr:MAG: hypothetical protein COX80_04625 [Candidatus Magasanikbacteria bacterium CG_4_10_14_0_2_um_filter_33_14]
MSEIELSMEEKGYLKILGENIYILPNLISEENECPFGGKMVLHNYDLIDALEKKWMTPDGVITPAGEKELNRRKSNKPVINRKNYSESKETDSVDEEIAVSKKNDSRSSEIIYHDSKSDKVTLNARRILMRHFEELEENREQKRKQSLGIEEDLSYDPTQDEVEEVKRTEDEELEMLLAEDWIEKIPNVSDDEEIKFRLTNTGKLMMKGGYAGPEVPEKKSKIPKGERKPHFGDRVTEIFESLNPDLGEDEDFKLKTISGDGGLEVIILRNEAELVSTRILNKDLKDLNKIRVKLTLLLRKRMDKK